MAAQKKSDLVRVVFLRRIEKYQPNDDTCFPAERAKALIDGDICRLYDPKIDGKQEQSCPTASLADQTF